MAQVEIIMYVALGFAAAALIALLLGRVVWSLAIGVGRRRAQRTAVTPAVAQLQAERNQLRAEYAMLSRKVEVRLDDLKSQLAEHMAEVSRGRNRIERLRAEVERLGVARSEAVSRERTVQQRLKGRIDDLSALSRQIEAQRRELMARKSQSVALREGVADQNQPEDAAGEARPPEPSDSDAEPLERRIEDTERQASELESELDRLDAIWTAKLADVASAVAVEPPPEDAAGSGASVAPEATAVNGSGAEPVAGEAEHPETPPDDDRKTGLANVVSLAQRIRALQRNSS